MPVGMGQPGPTLPRKYLSEQQSWFGAALQDQNTPLDPPPLSCAALLLRLSQQRESSDGQLLTLLCHSSIRQCGEGEADFKHRLEKEEKRRRLESAEMLT